MDYSIIECEQFGLSFILEESAHGVSLWSKPLGYDEAIVRKKNEREIHYA